MEGKIIVSICCLTYNHEKYISQCLEGFLIQKTNFIFEVLIHDDASTDNTAKIIREYEKKYPNIIKPVYQSENKYSKGISVSATYNFPRVKGKYIAMCEGDDYWTDPLKLQKQVDVLEANLDHSICYHKVDILEDGVIKTNQSDFTEERYKKVNKENHLTITDLLKVRNFMHTPSVLFRRSCLPKQIPFEMRYSTVGDYFFYVMLTVNNQLIYKLNDTMAVYRQGVGVFSTLNNINMSYTVLRSKVCILSFLDNDCHKEILLNQLLDQLCYMKTMEASKININQLKFTELLKIVLDVFSIKIKKRFNF